MAFGQSPIWRTCSKIVLYSEPQLIPTEEYSQVLKRNASQVAEPRPTPILSQAPPTGITLLPRSTPKRPMRGNTSCSLMTSRLQNTTQPTSLTSRVRPSFHSAAIGIIISWVISMGEDIPFPMCITFNPINMTSASLDLLKKVL